MCRRFSLWSPLFVVTSMVSMGCASTAEQPQTARMVNTEASPTASPEGSFEGTEAAVETKSGLGNTLKWQTATEIDNFAFDVYRADLEEGPFVRLTTTPIPGSGTSDVPSQYEYRDESIEPNKAYYYYVESISTGGVRERFTPVFRSKPKAPKGATEEEQGG